MAQLQRAIEDYIKYEKLITESDTKQTYLENNYTEALSYQHHNNFDISAAEKAYSALEAIEKHKNDVVNYSNKKVEIEVIIAKYISSLKGGKVTYLYHVNDERCTTLSYTFWLDNGKVCHNHQRNS